MCGISNKAVNIFLQKLSPSFLLSIYSVLQLAMISKDDTIASPFKHSPILTFLSPEEN